MRPFQKVFVVLVALALTAACDQINSTVPVKSNSGVTATAVAVPVGADNLTVEQRNARDRLIEDNKPGAIKHLYVISAFSGQVLMYSTVRGKVTSSGKRLTPTSVFAGNGDHWGPEGAKVTIGGEEYRTGEVLQDDGTYGTSVEYLYWWDTKGVYHQHYISGGQIVTISSQPLNVPHVLINLNEQR